MFESVVVLEWLAEQESNPHDQNQSLASYR